MKKFASILLFLLLIFSVCSVASAENTQGDFLLLDGLSWSMKQEDLRAYFGTEPEIDLDYGYNVIGVNFSSVKLPQIKGEVSLEFAFSAQSEEMLFCVAVIEMNKPLFALGGNDVMKDAYDTLISEGNRIYQDRSQVLFSSVEEMVNLFESDIESPYISIFAGGLKESMEIYQNLYESDGWEFITNTHAWIVDEKYATSVAYSGKKTNDNVIIAIFYNMESFMENMLSLIVDPNHEEETSLSGIRFGFPAGCSWGDDPETVKAALGDTYSQEEPGSVYAVFSDDPFTGGHYAMGTYEFTDNQLASISYTAITLDTEDYENIVSILTEDAGSPTQDEFSVAIRESILQADPTMKAEVWLVGDVFIICAYSPSSAMTIVSLVPWSTLLSAP